MHIFNIYVGKKSFPICTYDEDFFLLKLIARFVCFSRKFFAAYLPSPCCSRERYRGRYGTVPTLGTYCAQLSFLWLASNWLTAVDGFISALAGSFLNENFYSALFYSPFGVSSISLYNLQGLPFFETFG